MCFELFVYGRIEKWNICSLAPFEHFICSWNVFVNISPFSKLFTLFTFTHGCCHRATWTYTVYLPLSLDIRSILLLAIFYLLLERWPIIICDHRKNTPMNTEETIWFQVFSQIRFVTPIVNSHSYNYYIVLFVKKYHRSIQTFWLCFVLPKIQWNSHVATASKNNNIFSFSSTLAKKKRIKIN